MWGGAPGCVSSKFFGDADAAGNLKSPAAMTKGSGLKREGRGTTAARVLRACGPFTRWAEVVIRLEP